MCIRDRSKPFQKDEKDDYAAESSPFSPGEEGKEKETGSNPESDEEFYEDALAAQDFWTIRHDVLIRTHRAPRVKMFSLSEDTCPVPLRYVDVMRRTETDLEDLAERQIDDYWIGTDTPKTRDLSNSWVGKTTFFLLRPNPGPKHMWQGNRLTQIQKLSLIHISEPTRPY